MSFVLEPGQAMGVIGPSGAGKTSLAKAVTGAWPPAGGKMRLDSATLDQYDPDVLGSYIGYLPQTVTLFDGTIADNIARLQDDPDPAAIVEAAKKAAAHEMILEQPDGLRHPRLGRRRPPVGRPDPAHRPGPRDVRRPGACWSWTSRTRTSTTRARSR